ncbi:WD40 repeat domain-containing protein, partial [Phormidium sp. CCY1219]|uniref:WD40 repeat domain-containing protein n=1 Tax=Phormidium sp. CCY1219 TaxID=2886104 RepID=UPI002D1F72AA|nr:hypothetical protein [Phormidium sp. CCY1219]
VAIAPDGKRAVSASDDQTLKLWDLETGTELATLTAHSFYGVAAWDWKRAVSASDDETLTPHDAETVSWGDIFFASDETLTPHDAETVSWDDILFASGNETPDLSFAFFTFTPFSTGHGSGSVSAVAIAPDGKRAVSASDTTLKLWDLETGTELATLRGHSAWVNAVAITPDGKRA